MWPIASNCGETKCWGLCYFPGKTRWHLLGHERGCACTCEGPSNILQQNDFPAATWCQAMTTALQEGREKGSLVCTTGKKLLSPHGLGKGAWRHHPLRSATAVVWERSIHNIAAAEQIFWPHHPPVGPHRVEREEVLQQGDLEMMLKRWLVFNFTKPIAIPKPVIQGCAHCFAHFLVSHSFLPIAWHQALQPQLLSIHLSQLKMPGHGNLQMWRHSYMTFFRPPSADIPREWPWWGNAFWADPGRLDGNFELKATAS